MSRKPGGSGNECHVLADHDPEQPADDVVRFVQKVIAAEQSRRGHVLQT